MPPRPSAAKGTARAEESPARLDPSGDGSLDPFDAFLDSAPFDDEPDTPEERAAAAAGWAAYLRGESDSLEDVRRRLLGSAESDQPAVR